MNKKEIREAVIKWVMEEKPCNREEAVEIFEKEIVPIFNEKKQQITVMKKINKMTIAEFWIIDTGDVLSAGFGPCAWGAVRCDYNPIDQCLYIRTDSTSTKKIIGIHLKMDEFKPNLLNVPEPFYWTEEKELFLREAEISYDRCKNALENGAIVFDNCPFADRVPIPASMLDLKKFQDAQKDMDWQSLAELNASMECRVFIEMPIRSTNKRNMEIDKNSSDQPNVRPYSISGKPFSFCWTGMLSICEQVKTFMGTMNMAGKPSVPSAYKNKLENTSLENQDKNSD